MKALYPLKLSYITKEVLWGGSTLKERYHKEAPFACLGESWELSVREKEMSRVENGPCCGMTLADYITENGNGVVSARYTGNRFPLLIKFIDARDALSIQVHPEDAYSLANEGELGKTEMWYIVEAEPGARLVYGLKEGLSTDDFAAEVRAGRIADTLRYVEVHKGETYFIPAGQIHAIGAGILIAEIQQNSDITYRVYDYDRRQADGSLRQLHTDKALDVVRTRTEEEIDALRFADGKVSGQDLARCSYFRVRRLSGKNLPVSVTPENSFIHLLCVEGEGEILCGGERYPIRIGDSYFLPRGCESCTLSGTATVLLSALSEE